MPESNGHVKGATLETEWKMGWERSGQEGVGWRQVELDYKESWVQKNWCFWTVVLEETLKSLRWSLSAVLGLQGDPTSPS